MKVVEEQDRVRVMEGSWDVWGAIQEIVDTGTQEDPFYVMDLGEVIARYNKWKELLPRVEPFYAVKCNDDKLLVTALAALGAGFDCASKAEIELVSNIGVRPERIIFANPAKMASHIRHAAAAGVTTMTFDSETELLKIKQLMPNAKLVIRIRCDAAEAQCPLGIKFGCDPASEAPRLLKLAAVLQLDVVGVSFHVGSGARDFAVYAQAIQFARALFDLGGCVGHRGMRLLDIGGGFPGHSGSDLTEVAAIINAALQKHFPDPSVQVIAEPGRYFAAAAYTLAVMVHAKREIIPKESSGESHTMYFVNDGVYGSFNCVLYDHQVVHAEPLKTYPGSKPLPCSIWGPSCDGLDLVCGAARLPPLCAGDWLVFRDMGAYTLPVASAFNGFPLPRVRALLDHRHAKLLKDLWPLTEAHFMYGAPLTGPQLPDAATPPPSPPPPTHQDVFVECALK
ncbi:ornithine decarboxylase 1 [Plutella xylostella]|uniref:ornithine decarboxylase 1 n=1 Tax=Plutella xylostella TaxID=51655 RepID=UPI0020322A04|nr:ornithine decarboxylase 1 [Plutella xylostella]XP_048484083.1 ornithine decarboxylase 1 [Plutella xylostella]XP_048484084.1 ornithine decarboxylase 1 [Plutella xylostella]